MANSEVGKQIQGGAVVGLGLGVEGYGVEVNPTLLTAPATEITKIVDSIASTNLNEIATTIVHVPSDLLSTLAHAGPEGAVAGLAIGVGALLIGKGANIIHDARRGR